MFKAEECSEANNEIICDSRTDRRNEIAKEEYLL